jgi:hypothetical protein
MHMPFQFTTADYATMRHIEAHVIQELKHFFLFLTERMITLYSATSVPGLNFN